ncbi:ATP-dependent DNA helicase Q-like 1 [Dendronephthya gigantea]|uniref:ATP-dependent DNA helicase Q-like 1 n=1 Tax=Dendronephthya gigantea TaxID=151771 RepID=UPI00106A3E30|nr:ATP-dependent DNA helicase Q-like 1 [Dendronephthya gigantea]
MLEFIAFLSCLEFAILNSLYSDTVLKPKQVICLESVFLQKDVLCVLPTGYGKSLIFHLVLMLLFAKHKLDSDFNFVGWKPREFIPEDVNTIVIVVSPLNALISNQISRLNLSGIRASVLSVKDGSTADIIEEDTENIVNMELDFSLCEEEKLRNGCYHIIFTHPESFVTSKYGRELLLTKAYRENVVAIVVDEAHCILDWGSDFRKDYSKLGALCAFFPDVPVVAMTATASHADMKCIKESLGLKKCKIVMANPDRANIFYKKVLKHGNDADAVESILIPMAKDLLRMKIEYPLTVIYISLKFCGLTYKLFEHVLVSEQYFPVGSPPILSNRMFAQFHAPQTSQMKDEILKQLCSTRGTIRIVFATVAMGMGVDIPDIRNVIHVSPPCTYKGIFPRNWTCW